MAIFYGGGVIKRKFCLAPHYNVDLRANIFIIVTRRMHPGHNKPIWISNFERGTRAFRRVPFSYCAPPTLFCIKRKRIFNFRSKTLSRLTVENIKSDSSPTSQNVWRVTMFTIRRGNFKCEECFEVYEV